MAHDPNQPPVSLTARLTFSFLWWIIIARTIVGFTRGTLWPVAEWLDGRSWLYALGFAIIGTGTYWIRIRREG